MSQNCDKIEEFHVSVRKNSKT